MCEILSATPALFTAFSESPPPTTETAPDSATAFAIATVPRSKDGISKIPIGPFQMIRAARAILTSAIGQTEIPQIDAMLRNADMELHWALWNLGEPVGVRPESEYREEAAL